MIDNFFFFLKKGEGFSFLSIILLYSIIVFVRIRILLCLLRLCVLLENEIE